jgi:N-acyl homoserine lactone hydrolase
MSPDKWIIAPLVLGTAVRDKSQTLLYKDIGVPLKGALLAWLLMRGEEKILVDTGVFGPVERPEIRSRYDQIPGQMMEPQLGRFSTTPDEIPLVICTHLHLDHAGGSAYFKKARFVVQKREMEYAKDPLPIHKGAYDMDFSGMKFDYVDGDAEIVSGIKVILTPGHSPGGQAVLVDTEKGLYILAGDTITHFVNMDVPAGDSFWPNGIYIDLREYYWSLDRLKALGGFILPGHDMLVLEKNIYP